ncbi:leucyl aminopeptidase family protein [Sessilibacter corallicola]|uniref:Leucyl aminopeptidase family protein n=1 Tax=Sessilibacter corallicola TaxID=2904075 RepID=A0ABQ0A4P8_9GAMM
MTKHINTLLPSIGISESGTPLIIIQKSQFESWKKNQNENIQNWLTTSGYEGEGLSLIPGENLELSQAIFTTDTSDYFCCGELYNLLPEGEFKLQASEHSAEDEIETKVAFGYLIGGYQFTQFKSKRKDSKNIHLNISDNAVYERVKKLTQSIFLTRDLINTPADSMMPENLAAVANGLATVYGGACRQVCGEELLKENYPTIYTVGQASVHAPQLIDLYWGDINNPKIIIIGKGVCFDSGGLDLKPSSAMRLMKKDMGGAAQVLGLANMIMAFELPIHLRVMIPAVENAVSGNAFRPGDVIKTRKGMTVEVDNTDAEGRLVLCDALAEANNDKPDLIIDFATLTGAARVALGTELPAMFSTSSEVADGIRQAGEEIDDPVWQLPLHKAYRSTIKSDVADILNCAPTPFGGAITAALFLQEFVDEDTDWVHFDVMAWNNRKLPGRPVGGEAMGIRAVLNYLVRRYDT